MKDRIKNYVDKMFTEVSDNKQLRELKEEVSANLLEKINDLIARGDSGEVAFQKAVSSLGDMSELIGSLKKISQVKSDETVIKTFPLDKKHAIGYVVASAVFLFGIMVSGVAYLRQKDLLIAFASFMPFLLVSAPIFGYFGLTQETTRHYGMNNKRALSYTLAGELLLLGAGASGIMYFQKQELFIVFSTLMPFLIVSAIAFLYLGLTEKKRRKMGSEWEQHWVEYYSNPQSMTLRGAISGALWVFAIAAFFLVAFTLGWKYSWIVFVAAVGIEILIEPFFAARRK